MSIRRLGTLCALGLASFFACGGLASAAAITFSSATTISGAADVSTLGDSVFAYDWSNVSTAVNGVNFVGTSATGPTTIGSNVTLDGTLGSNTNNAYSGGGSSPWSTLPSAYQNALEGGNYGGGSVSNVTLDSLISGHQYAVQVWVDDSRGGGEASRNETVNGGGNTVTLQYDATQSTGGVGQFTVGYFSANAATQVFALTGNASTQLNALQLRDVTNIGYWNGVNGSTWDTNTTANFATNVYTAAFANGTFNQAASATKSAYFSDYYYNNGGTVAVTQNIVNVAAGGVSTGTVYFQNNAVNYTINSSDSAGITGSTAVTLQGTGMVTLTGSHSYTGTTTVSSGTLQLGTGVSGQDGVLTGTAKITNNSALVYNLFGSQTAAYPISGTGSLATVGPGTITLAASNNYTGPTNILAGTLALGPAGAIAQSPTISLANGATFDVSAQAGAFHLVSGQTLTGTGNFSVNGAMTANSGSTILPGGPGAFGTTTVGGLTLGTGSVLKYDFGTGQQDLINVTGSNGLDVLGGGIDLYQANGSSPFTTPGTYAIADYSGSFGGSASALSVLDPDPTSRYSFAASGGSLTLTIAALPSWNGGGAPNFNWSNAANWTSLQAPTSGNVLIFAGTSGLANTNDITGLNATGISFGSSAGAFNLSGNSIQLSGPIANYSSVTQTLGMNVGLSGSSQTISTLPGNVVISGVISDGGAGYGITTSGSGTVYLTAANTFSGPTSVSSGTLTLQNGLALQNSTVASGGIVFDVAGSQAFTFGGLTGGTNLALTDNGNNPVALSVGNNNFNTTYTGVMSGSGSLTKVGGGIFTLTGGNTFTGTTTIGSGTLQIGNNSALQDSVLNLNGAGALAFNSGVTSPTLGGLSGSNGLTLPSTVTSLTFNPAAGVSSTYSGNLAGLNSGFEIQKSGAGAQTLSGSVTLGTNETDMTGGTLNVNGSLSGPGRFTITTAVFNVNAGATFTMNGGNQFTMANGNGQNAVVNDFGTINLSSTGGADTLVGQASSGTGTINVMNGGVLNVNISGFRLGNNGGSSPVGILTLNPGSKMTLDNNDDGNGFVVGNQSGATGVVNLNGGTLTTGRVIKTGGSASGTFNFNGGWLVPGISSTSFLTLNGRANVRNGGALIDTNGFNITIPQALVHSNISGDNAIDGGLTLNDTAVTPGTLTLNGANTYTGPTNILAGTLALGSGGSINSSDTIAIANGLTFNVSAQGSNYHLTSGQTLTGTGSFTLNGSMTANSGSVILSAGAGQFRTFNVGNLTLNTGSALNFNLGAGTQDLINDLGNLAGTGGGVNLYQANGTPLTAAGTYALIDYAGASTLPTGSLSVLDANPTSSYTFSETGGSLDVTVGTLAASAWNGGGNPNFVWSNAANWTNSAVPVSGYVINFLGTIGLSNTNDIANLNVGGLVFSSSAGAFNLTGNSIQLSGGILNNSTATQTIGMNVGLLGSESVNAAAGNIVLAGVISDGGAGYGITTSGSGTVTLAAANTYSGPTSVSGGTLNLSNSLALQNSTLVANAGSMVFGTAGSQAFTLGALSGGANFALTDNGGNPVALTVGNNNAITTYTGVMSGSGSLTLIGGGMLALTSNQAYTGATLVNGGTLQIASNSTLQNSVLGSNGTGYVAPLSSGFSALSTIGLTGSGNLTLDPAFTSLTLSPASSSSQTFSGMLTGLASGVNLTMNGPGAQTLSGGVNFGTGSVTVSAGALTLGGYSTYNQTNVNGGTLNLDGVNSSSSGFYTRNTSVVNINGTQTNTGGMIVEFYTAGTSTVNVAGTLNISGGGLIGQEEGTGILNILSGGVVNVLNSGDLRIGNTSYNAPVGILTMSPGSQLNMDGSANFILGNSDGASYTQVDGTFNLNGGTVTTARAITGGYGTAILNLNGGLIVSNFPSSAFVSMGSNSNSRINVENGGAIFNTNGNADTIVSPLLHSNIAGDNASDGGLTLNDTAAFPGTLTLNASNTYTGPTTIVAGTLALGASGSIAQSPTISLANGTTFDVSAQAGNFHLVSGQTLTGTGSITVNGAMTANAGSIILAPGAGLYRTLSVGGLTLSPNSVLNYDIGSGTQDSINVTGANGLTINGGGVNLYGPDGATPFSTPGTYALIDYAGASSGAVGNLSVLDANPAETYTFIDTGSAVDLNIAVQTTWNGNGNPVFNWSNAANWSSLQAPVNGNAVVFSGSQGLSNNNDISNLQVAGLTFDSSAGAFNLSGNSLQLSGAVINNSTATQTIGMNLGLFGGNAAFNAAAGNIVVTGIISDGDGSRGIGKSGSGTLTLMASNSYSGGTYLSAGVLQAANNGSLGYGTIYLNGGALTSTGTGGLTFNNSFSLGGNATLGDAVNNGPLNFSGGGTIAAANPQLTINSPTTFSGAIGGGSNGLTLAGPSVAAFTAPNTYTGTTTVSGGTLQLNSGSGPAIAGNLAVSGGAVQVAQGYQMSGSVSVSSGLLDVGPNTNVVTGVQLTGGTITGTSGLLTSTTDFDMQSGVAAATLDGSVGLHKTTAGTVVLSNSNTYTGATTINAGTLVLAHPLATQYSTVTVGSSGAVAFAAGNTSPILGGLAGAGNVALATAASEPVALNVGGNGQNSTYSGSLTGAGSLVKQGAGTLTVTATSSYSGATNITAGVLQLNGNSAPTAPPVPGYTYWFDASNLGLANGASVTSLVNQGSVGGTAVVPGGANHIAPTYIANAGTGTGLGALSFTGNDGGNSSALQFTQDTSIRTVFSIFEGSSFLLTDIQNGAYNFHRSEASGTDTDPTLGLWGNDASPNVTGGTTLVNGSNTYPNGQSTSTVNLGTGTLPDAYNLIAVETTGPVTADSFNADRNSVHSGDQSQAELIMYDTPLTSDQIVQVEAYLNAKWGLGIPGLPTFGAGSNLLPITTPVNIDAGATLDLNGANQQVASLSGSGLLTSTNASVPGTFTVAGSASTVFYGQITDSGPTGSLSLNVAGPGMLTLAGDNTFYGATTISGGTLQLGTGAPGNDGSLDNTSGVTNNAALVYNLSGSQTAAYAITGSGSITKAGPGTLTLTNPNNANASGAVNIQGGLLVDGFGSGGALPTYGPLNVSGGSLDLEGNIATVSTLSGSGTIGNGASGAGNLAYLVVTDGGSYSGKIQDGGFGGNSPTSLYLTDGTLVLSPGAPGNTFTGGTVVEGGVLDLKNSEALADGSSLIVGDPSQFAPIVAAGAVAAPAAGIAAVPEPGTLALLGLAALIVGASAGRARRKSRRVRG